LDWFAYLIQIYVNIPSISFAKILLKRTMECSVNAKITNLENPVGKNRVGSLARRNVKIPIGSRVSRPKSHPGIRLVERIEACEQGYE